MGHVPYLFYWVKREDRVAASSRPTSDGFESGEQHSS